MARLFCRCGFMGGRTAVGASVVVWAGMGIGVPIAPCAAFLALLAGVLLAGALWFVLRPPRCGHLELGVLGLALLAAAMARGAAHEAVLQHQRSALRPELSTCASVRRARTREPTFTGLGKRTLSSP